MYDIDGYSGFHESYYTHICPIIPEKDVVYTDIKGNGCLVYLKRWWHDLFLLSASNGRYIGFYNSSHAMRIERFRQFRKYPRRIHPLRKNRLILIGVIGGSLLMINNTDNISRSFWNWVLVFAMLTQKILFRFTSSILFNIHLSIYYLAAFLEVFIISDIFINLMTGYADKDRKKVVLNVKKGLFQYCSTKLFLHMMSAIPVHWFMFLRYGNGITCNLCKCNRFIAALKIISIFSLYRVFETTANWTGKRHRPDTHTFKFLRIATVGLITMLQFYDIVDVLWMLTVIREKKLDSSSFIGMLIVVRYGIIQNVPRYMVICYDISRIFKSLFLFSFGLKPNSGFVWDKMSSVIAYIIANAFYAWTLLECYSMMSRNIFPKENIMKTKTYLTNLLASRQLSDELRHKIDQYFDFKSTRLKIFKLENGLYKSLPSGLKREITLSYYSKFIMRIHRLFSKWPIDLIKELAMLVRSEIYLSNDIITEAGTPGSGLMIVDVGVLAIYNVNNQETGHLIDGDYFGELCLITDKEVQMSNVIAVTPCRILILDKFIFRKFMRQYPEYFYELKERLINRRLMLMKDRNVEGKPEITRQPLQRISTELNLEVESGPLKRPSPSSIP